MKTYDTFVAEIMQSLLVLGEQTQSVNKPLNKPFRTPNGPKKFSVYVKNDKGNIVKVNFGDPNMEIKRDSPKRQKAFSARHNCKQKTDKTSPGYWSCKMWQKSTPCQQNASKIIDKK